MASVVNLNLSSEEDIPEFLSRDDKNELLFFCNKAQLCLLAEHFGVEVTVGCKKGEILLKVVRAMQVNESLSEKDGNGERSDKVVSETVELERLKLEGERMRLEFEGREREMDRQERERERERAHELEVLRLRANGESSSTRLEGSSFNAVSAIKLVPSFSEKEVVEFFLSFEKVARSLNWPEDKWTTIIQCRFVGKAQKVYSALSDEISKNYNQVKEAILKAYKLVPEAYREKFRGLKKSSNQTFVEFAHDKERAFEDWCRSKEIDGFDKLRMLILSEEFKDCIPKEIKVHLEDIKVDDLYEAARLADEYSIAHKFSFRSKFSPRSDKKGFREKSADRNRNEKDKSSGSPKRGKKDLTCYYCKKRGHIRSECPSLKKSQEGKKPVGLVSKIEGQCREHKHRKRPYPSWRSFKDFISEGRVSVNNGDEVKAVDVTILRDTGAAQSMILESALPKDVEWSHKEYVLLGGFPDTITSCPLLEVDLCCPLKQGHCKLAVVPSLPLEGIDVLLANDLVGSQISDNPCISCFPQVGKSTSDGQYCMPVTAVTRSQVRDDPSIDLSDSWLSQDPEGRVGSAVGNKEELDKIQKVDWGKEALVREQKADAAVALLRESASENNGVEADLRKPRFVLKDGILFRQSRPVNSPAQEEEILEQVVVPKVFQEEILREAHEGMTGGHLGIRKTLRKVSSRFYWNGLKKTVSKYVKTCPTCQIIGNPNQKIKKAPLVPIPSVGEPFVNIAVDIVGPLPRTRKGNEYLLTIVDRVSRYPEAVPIRKINAKVVVEVLINFFSKFGMPSIVQTDCGTNFKSKYFEDRMSEFGIKHVTSSPYHPESQGTVERFHQTLKTMMKKYCRVNECDWDQSIPYLLFAIRSSVNESLGVSPFDMVFGHHARGPLDVIREHWGGENPDTNLVDYIHKFKNKLHQTWEFANKNLKKSQRAMKQQYDVKTKPRSFEVGESVLALLPVPGNPLKARFSGPWKVVKKLNDTDYVVETPDRRKKYQTCHINMLKEYHDRSVVQPCLHVIDEKENDAAEFESSWPRSNSEVLKNLDSTLTHLTMEQRSDLVHLIHKNNGIFTDSPGRTDLLLHDVDVGDNPPIKQFPYRLHPEKAKLVEKEVQYMMKHNLITHSSSPWSAPVVLVKKDHNQLRLCFDYRKLNAVTVTDNFPLPRVDDCIDRIGHAKVISKFDFLKGYWQIGMTERAQKVSAFVTRDGLYECCVMPFGMKNSASTFQRLMNLITKDLEGCIVYIDDVIIYSDDWATHLDRIEAFFRAVKDAGLVINLSKCEFVKAQVKYLGHKVGLGRLLPKDANIESVYKFPVPVCKRQVRRFLGLVGYYRRFVKNFTEISFPLTELLKKQRKFAWGDDCQSAFDKLRAVLTNHPILHSPDWSKPFVLATDASDVGVGAVLLQSDSQGIEHPISYFSKKLSPSQRKYSTVEKEALALILALQHFEVYVSGGREPIEVRTDHNPLVFLNRFKNKNSRLTRWSILLQEWNLLIKHVNRKDNVVPDALSRI